MFTLGLYVDKTGPGVAYPILAKSAPEFLFWHLFLVPLTQMT